MAATYSSLVGLAVGGKYEIRKVLGAGGMGVVCEAVHLDLGKKVAVKLIDKNMKESELIVARFRREARALGQIQSEHIVDVFDVGADKRVGLYIVMELLVGEDLQRRLDREKRVDVRTGVMIAHQLARGLAKAHEANVIHRDLKPANVFLTTRDNGQMLVKILDFGVSKVLGETGQSARITGSGSPIGTPLYMSPEQAEGKDDTDGRADIWSLGAVLYEALSGDPPFTDRGSYHATIVGILTSRPKLLFDAAAWVPRDLATVVDACLVHDRDARIKDAGTFTQRLLEAYPAVLPDGTGRHTAVIIPQATAAVDATGDTEFFTSASMPAAHSSRPSGGSSRPSNPADSRPASSGPKAISSDAERTAAATPVAASERETTPPTAIQMAGLETSGETRSVSSGPKTAPLLSPPHSSASGGVAMPGTPPIIEPLPMSEVAPDTTRDDLLAMRAERRRWVALAAVSAVIIAVALAGFLVGRRSNNIPTTAAPHPAESPHQVAPTAATESPKLEPLPELPKMEAPKPEPVKEAPKVEPKPKPRMRFRPKDPPPASDAPKGDPVEAPAPDPAPPKSDPPAEP